jgi:hypothetical protein
MVKQFRDGKHGGLKARISRAIKRYVADGEEDLQSLADLKLAE